MTGFRFQWLSLQFALGLTASAATLSDSSVDAYNVRIGTQTFAGLYQFTTNTLLVETAEAIRDLGSDIFKGYLGKDYPRQYRISLPPNVTNLLTLARDEPSCRRVLNMPFRHILLWAYPFSTSDSSWSQGYSSTARANDYREIYELTRYLLTNYNHSGKSFYLGHWEGDWYLLPGYNTATNPTPTAIQGMIDWLNNRQKAIDDARRNTPHQEVEVYGYAEANRVLDALSGNASINQRVINKVVPYVTNLDFVSWSSYDGMNLGSNELTAVLNYMQSQLPTNKTAAIQGRRVFIGEYGWGASSSQAQEPLTRAYIQHLLPWGPRFILFWEIYNNEPNRSFWLVDSNNTKVAAWHLHHRFINSARLLTARFHESNGRLPTDSEFAGLLTLLMNTPLPPPVNLSVTNGSASLLEPGRARVTGTMGQGIYGSDCAAVWVFWGLQDGGTSPGAWEHSLRLGVNTNFNPVPWSAELTNLVAQTNYYFRFHASNDVGEAWAPVPGRLSTATVNAADYGSRMKITFSGYDGTGQLDALPVLVRLGTNLPGFSYARFASPTGGDLRFTDESGVSVLPHEIDEWNTNGISSAWVRLNGLAGSSDFLWAYWGNPLAPVPPASSTNGSVWLPGSELVWHLQENSLPYKDSTGLHPAVSGSAPESTAGVIGRAGLFNGSSHFLSTGALQLGDSFTLSAWFKSTATNIQTIWANKAGGWNADGFAFFVNSFNSGDGRLLLETGNGTTGLTASTRANAVTPGAWQFLTAVVNRAQGTARLFVDGVDSTEQSAILTDFKNNGVVNLGRFSGGGFYLKGSLDEARIDKVLRSADWVRAGWLSANSSSFAVSSAVIIATPTLSVVATAPLTLTWPASGVGFSLYSTSNLVPGTTWFPFSPAPSLVAGRWQAAADPDSSIQAFFRLLSR